MRVLLIVDRDFAHRELRLVRKIAIGLVDAGSRTLLALPADMATRFADIPGVSVIGYRDRGVPWTRSLRAREIAEAAAESSNEPTIVHAFGGKAFSIASDFARLIGAELVLEVHGRALAQHAAAVLNDEMGSGLALAPSASLVNALIAAGVPNTSVRELPWGVGGRGGEPPRDHSEVLGIVLAGTGNDAQAWESVLRGLASVASRREDFLILADDTASLRAGIHKLVNAIGLSPLFSRIPKIEAERELIVRADMMLWPDHDGEHRSIVLDAMSFGVPIVAAEDRDVPALSNPSIARLVMGDAAQWAAAIEALLASPDQRLQLGRAAHEYIAQNHRPSKHVAGLIDAYEWMLGKDAISIAREQP